jgi:hypothetical protein
MSFTLLSERNRTANKEHHCIWCGEKVLVGERYVSVAGKHYSEFQFNRYHPECLKAMHQFFTENRYEDEFEPHEFKRGTTISSNR